LRCEADRLRGVAVDVARGQRVLGAESTAPFDLEDDVSAVGERQEIDANEIVLDRP
jgi:hypothetical protein